MSTYNQKNQKESIPIYFSSNMPSKELLIGKTRLQSDKNKFKVKTTTTQIIGVKEFTLLNDSNKNIIYSGRENHQDSNYVLMKCNSDCTEIRMYPANNWVNFFKSSKKTIKKEGEERDKEKERKDRIKENNNRSKKYFNFHLEVKTEEQKKKGKPKKAGVLDRNLEELFIEKEKKRYLDEFKEDSHSSENDPDLKQESESEKEDYNKINEKKKKEEEKAKEKEEKNEEEEEEEEDEDDNYDFSSLDNIENFESKYGNIDNLIGNKRDREKTEKDEMEEELENLFRKKNRMTYNEIVIELKKKFDIKTIEKYIEDLLNEITSNFLEKNEETYYYLKK